jgi:hypothetical protein
MHGHEPITRDLGELSQDEAKELMREAVKEAASEWLDDKFRQFGKWSIMGLAAAGLVAIVYFILQLNGWHK